MRHVLIVAENPKASVSKLGQGVNLDGLGFGNIAE